MCSIALAAAVEGLEPPADADSLAEALRLRDRLDARIALGVGRFDRDGAWALEGASSSVAWLRQRAGLTAGAAASMAKTAKRLHDAPVLAGAWADGSVSGGQVQAVVANVNDRAAPLFAEHERDLVPVLAGLTVRETGLVMQAWRARAEALLDGDGDAVEPERSLHLSRTLDGRAELKGAFDAASATAIEAALRQATTADGKGVDGVERAPAERRADALADVCRFFLDHHDAVDGARHRPHVNVVMTLRDLEARGAGRTVDGTLLDAASIAVLLCDADIHRVLTDARGTILDYGRATRSVSPSLFTALAVRDGHCRMVEGCDRPPEWCDAHHVVPWQDGGETKAANLVLACHYHHHLAHRRRWRQTLAHDGTYTVDTPDGRSWTTRPRGATTLGLAIAS